MQIDPAIEKALRSMFGHVLRGELEEIPQAISSFPDDRHFREALALCAATSGYVAIQACGNTWPADVALRRIAEKVERAARSVRKFTLAASDVYDYLARSVLGRERTDQVFTSSEDVVNLPILITASMLLTFRPSEQHWWQYLDQIEAAIEVAWALDTSVLPAAVFRAHMPKA
ncbi:MAG TPA: hypothetical protein VN969_38165 [Streptosporangiaceae bacterium]|nr:hypothetical protein [Streptosporangiaceae bacterium]